jgi:hypothetical protein
VLEPGALAASGLPDPAPFDAVLAARARDGGFDYRGATGQDRKRLAAYLANLGDARFAEMTAAEKKAFLINAYNAWAIQTMLDHPGKKITAVDGAFQKTLHRIGGRAMTLDQVEDALRSAADPRVHFAIVCASRSCPALAPKAYVAEALDETLDRQARAFVNDASKNRIDRKDGTVALSMIFRWNRKEFEREGQRLNEYVSRFVTDLETARWLAEAAPDPSFLDYDWSPNQPEPGKP